MLRSTRNAFAITKTFTNLQITTQARYVHRWVGPTLRELRKRAEKLGPQKTQPRSGFIEWNHRAEMFAFGKRLQEEFQLPLLQTAFTQRCYIVQEEQRQRELGIEEVDLQMTDNANLAARGEHLTKEYIQAYLQHSLPKMPVEGQQALTAFLLSEPTLAHVASQLGMKELIFSATYPPTEESLARSLLAVIGALAESSGVERSFIFIRDFICTQLSQRDLSELWHIEAPEELLQRVCEQRKLPTPEPRLIGNCGKNTVLAAYQVGIYGNKQLMGKGYGEDLNTAIKSASLDALHTLFGMQDHARPFNFQIQVEPKNEQLKQN